MLRLKHILSVLFLVIATSVLAQETYVIDSVCVGTERTYRRDGEKGYTYDWYIIDKQNSDTLNVSGVDYFETPALGDTLWGNEIFYLWDHKGIFDITVQVYSHHGCDTLEQGSVKVFEQPEAIAGNDLVFCNFDTIVLEGDSVWNHSFFYWSTTGDGTFDDPYKLHPTYYLGATDSLNSEVTLFITAEGLADNGTCGPAIDSVTFRFSRPDIEFTVEELLCYNDSNATAKVTITGGLPPFSFDWEGPAGFVASGTDSIGGLWAGTYILTVTDANLCEDRDTVEFVNPPQMLAKIDSLGRVSCYGYADGFIEASAYGGTGILTFNWEGSNGYTSSDDSVYNLLAGNYILTVKDENGCELIDTVTVEEPDPLMAVIDTAFDVSCYGFNNGSALVVVSEGTGPYRYSWSTLPPQDSARAVNLAPGWVIATITDSNGCAVKDSVYINEPLPLVLSADSLNIRCDAGKLGEIDLTVEGGTKFSTTPFYLFEWTDDAGNSVATTEDVTGIVNGNQYYTVVVTDSMGCADSLSIYINEIPMMEMLVNIDSALCYGDTWNINLTLTEGNPPYFVTWTDTFGVLIDTAPGLFGIPSGVYNLQVYDSDSCELNQQFILTEPPLIMVEIVAEDSVLCKGEQVALHGNPTGGAGTIIHSWGGNGAPYLNSLVDADVVFDPPAAGNYQFIYSILDEAGCDASDTVEIDVYPQSYSYDSIEVCAGSGPFTWSRGIIVSTDIDSTYLDTLFGMNQHGCDSFLTLDVKVLYPADLDTTLYVCENEAPFTLFNHAILPDRDSIYLDTAYYSASGCDSLYVTIQVFTLPLTDTLIEMTLCSGAGGFQLNNRWIQTDSSQVYLDTLSGANQFGCDSLLTYNVTIVPPAITFVFDTLCQDAPAYAWSDTIVVQTLSDSIYEARLKTFDGCDSLVYLDVHIIPSTGSEIDTFVCYTDQWFPWSTDKEFYAGTDGSYQDTVVNAAGCDSVVTLNVKIVYPDELTLDTILCEGTPSFVWGVNNIYTIDSYADGTYSDTLQNRFGCDSVVVLNTTIIKKTVSHDTIFACEEFTWLGGNGQTYTSSGTYLHTVGTSSCADSMWLHLVVSPPLQVDFDVLNVLCYGDSTGAVNLTINGGIAPFDILWNTGGTTKDLFNLPAGNYNAIVTDVLGCSAAIAVEITQPDSILITLDQITDVVVNGSSTGSIEVEVLGGMPGYSYLWQDAMGTVAGTQQDLFNVPAGTYTLLVTDANNCTSAIAYTVNEPGLSGGLSIVSVPAPALCYGESGGSIELDVTGGSGNYSYDWSGPGNYVSKDEDISGLMAGTYTVVVVDMEDSALADTIDVAVGQPDKLKISYTKTDVGNSSEPVGSIDLTVEGGTGGYRILWTLPDGSTSTNEDLNNLAVGSYIAEVTDANGCTAREIIQITNYGLICPPGISICPDEQIPAPYANLSEFIAQGGDTVSFGAPIVAGSWMHLSDLSNGETCPEIITRTYVISNQDGETSACEQLIIREDTEKPTLTIPPHIVEACSSYDPPHYTRLSELPSRASYSDNCEIVRIEEVLPEEIFTASCPKIIRRFYQVFDACGNASNVAEEVIRVETITSPTVIKGIPDLVNVGCNVPSPLSTYSDFRDLGGEVVAYCSIDMQWWGDTPSYTEPGVVLRTYRFYDECSSIDYVQKIHLDADIPEFTPLAPLCQYSKAPELSDTSLNGIRGTWNPAFISTSEPGTTVYAFTPDDATCTAPAFLTMEVLPAVKLSENLDNHVDIGYDQEQQGRIDLNIEGGTAPFTIEWSGPNGFSATSEDISNLSAGYYTVTVVDAAGCSAMLSVAITSQHPIIACLPDTIFECPNPSVYPAFTNINDFIAGGGAVEPLSEVTSFYSHDEIDPAGSYCLTILRTYVVGDSYGNLDSCTQRIDFYDNILPLVVAPAGGSAECLSSFIPNIESLEDFLPYGAVSDNCALDSASFKLEKRIVRSLNTSEVTYVFSIRDICGNLGKDSAVYILSDTIPPNPNCNSITVHLGSDGNYVLTDIDMENISAGSSDDCTSFEGLEINVTPSEFTCEDVESGRRVYVEVVDEAGNVGECWADIFVVDELPPVALCRDITVALDAAGEANITLDMIDAGTYDNCKLKSVQLSREHFDCTDVGDNTVRLVATDAYGNVDSCEAIVTVIDEIPPYISCIAGDTIQLSEADGTFALIWNYVTDSVWDECGIDTVLLDQYLLDCNNIGQTTITATAYDVNGNINSCAVEFVIIGNTPPNVQNDSAITAVNMPVDINVVLNDYDLKTNINIASLGIEIGPKNGSVEVSGSTGIVTYVPAPNFVGTDRFFYSICDDGVPCKPECGQAIVFVTVGAANKPPVALDDYFDVACIRLSGNVAINDSDPDLNDFVVDPVPVTSPTNGTLVLFEDGYFEYEPFIDFTEGIDSFRYQIWDEPLVGPALSDTAWVYITRVADNDCDGVADIDDIDDDNDGIRDNIENGGFWPEDPGAVIIDSDQDGIPDYLDIDSDNDGIVDNIEGQEEHGYIEPDGWRDDNNNGWDDRYDDQEGGYAFDLNLTDTDGDGIPDYLDSDADNDNVPDFIEGNDDNADGIADVLRFYSDLDRDGLDDAYDWLDGWGIPNLVDNETGSIAPLQDFDGDGWRDWRDINDEDDEYLTKDEDINGNGDYSDDDLDLDGHPEYLDTEMECELFIPEGFSPNDDGVHDFFQILCIYPRYPDAKLMIFNRNGQLIWEKEKYGNYDYWGWNEAWWWGTSDNRFTLGRSGGLPAGNYIYVLELNDGRGTVHNGTVMIAY